MGQKRYWELFRDMEHECNSLQIKAFTYSDRAASFYRLLEDLRQCCEDKDLQGYYSEVIDALEADAVQLREPYWYFTFFMNYDLGLLQSPNEPGPVKLNAVEDLCGLLKICHSDKELKPLTVGLKPMDNVIGYDLKCLCHFIQTMKSIYPVPDVFFILAGLSGGFLTPLDLIWNYRAGIPDFILAMRERFPAPEP